LREGLIGMVMRINGMSSGMDIDKIVSDLMKVERMPQTKLIQKRDIYSFTMDLYREINTKMAAFRDAMNSMRYSSTMTGMKASSSSSEVTATVNKNIPASNFEVTVTNVATAASMTSSGKVSKTGLSGSPITTPVTIDASNNRFLMNFDGTTKFIMLESKTYSTPEELQVELQTQVNKEFGKDKIQVRLSGDQFSLAPVPAVNGFEPQIALTDVNGALNVLGFNGNKSYRLNMNDSLANNDGKFSAGGTIESGEFNVNGVKIEYTTSDSIQDIMNRVNSSAANVTMTYDDINDTFVFKNKQTGSTSVTFEKLTDNNFLDAIRITDPVNSVVSSAAGTDAEFSIKKSDGTVLSGLTSSSNQYTITDPDLAGITLTINKKTTTPVKITAEPDADNIVNKVKAFVTAYNDLIDLVNRRLSETKARGYSPLTEDQKGSMNDKEIDLWNSKVKLGLLRDSSILKDIKNSMRGLFTKSVSGVSSEFNSLFKIGITTVPYVQGITEDAGKLQIDETALRNAIAKDPDAVSQLFTNDVGVNSQEGIAVSLYKMSNDFISSLIKTAGRVGGSATDITTDFGSKTVKIQQQINAWNDKLNKKEDVYYKRFAAMEQAMNKSNATLSWLSQQLN